MISAGMNYEYISEVSRTVGGHISLSGCPLRRPEKTIRSYLLYCIIRKLFFIFVPGNT